MQNAVPFHIPSALFPVEHRFLDLDGVRIHYVDEGAGDTLLLLHCNPLLNCDAGGLSANGQVWAPEGGDQPYEVKLQADGIILKHVKKLRYAELDETTLIPSKTDSSGRAMFLSCLFGLKNHKRPIGLHTFLRITSWHIASGSERLGE